MGSKCGSEDPDPDPLLLNVDPRIRIHVKMRWIRNAGFENVLKLVFSYIEFENKLINHPVGGF